MLSVCVCVCCLLWVCVGVVIVGGVVLCCFVVVGGGGGAVVCVCARVCSDGVGVRAKCEGMLINFHRSDTQIPRTHPHPHPYKIRL